MKLYRYIVFFIILLFINQPLFNQSNVDYKNLTFEHITIRDGLPSMAIYDIIQDKEGFMWFASEDGLIKYDANTFMLYQRRYDDTTSISNNNITCLDVDGEGNIWAGTTSGLNRLDKRTGIFHRYSSNPTDTNTIWENKVLDIYCGLDSMTWIATDGGLSYFNAREDIIKRVYIKPPIIQAKKSSIKTHYKFAFTCIAKGKDNVLWLGTWGYGLYRYDMSTGKAKNYYFDNEKKINIITSISVDGSGNVHFGSKDSPLSTFSPGIEAIIETGNGQKTIHSLFIDKNNYIWTGHRERLNIFFHDGSGNTISYEPSENDISGISPGNIKAIYQDKAGSIWLSVGRGLDIYHPSKNYFHNRHVDFGDKKYNDSGKSIYMDSQGNIWFGTFGDGLLKLDDDLTIIKRYLHEPGNKLSSIAGNLIFCINEDPLSGELWVGTDKGISIIDPQRGMVIKNITKTKGESYTLTHDLIYDIYHDSRRTTWIATQEGLDYIGENSETVNHMTEEDGLCFYKVRRVTEDKHKKLWFGTYNGLARYDPETGEFKCYRQHGGEKGRNITNQNITGIHVGKDDYLWVATMNGLNLIDTRSGDVHYFQGEKGVTGVKFMDIAGDHLGRIWTLSNAGVTMVHPVTHEMFHYGSNNGLRVNGSGFFLKDSILLLAEENAGLYKFNVNNLKKNRLKYNVCITDIMIDGQSIEEMGRIALKGLIDSTFRFRHFRSSFEFRFTLLNYISPGKNKYWYKLDGIDESWKKTIADQHFAKYSDLRPGKYTFKVKAVNNDGIESNNIAKFNFVVAPPWWKTYWAFILYVIMILFSILLIRKIHVRLSILNTEIQQAKLQHLTDEFKLRFLTNVSHDLRTPLSLISLNLDNVIDDKMLPDKLRTRLKQAKFNNLRVNKMVNELLDYRKLTRQDQRPNLKKTEIIAFTRSVYTVFKPYCIKHGINYGFKTNIDQLICWSDIDIYEKVLYNLISNACKHTPENGEINIELLFDERLTFSICNSGPGIPDEYIDKIFDRFFQVPGSFPGKGSGLGLSIVKESVDLLEGKITVSNQVKGRTVFTVELPVKTSNEKAGKDEPLHDNTSIMESGIEPMDGEALNDPEPYGSMISEDKSIMLIIEDNMELRKILANIFSENFNILEAENGKMGMERAVNNIPDIIISDVMMPVMDGVDFCGKCRNNDLTSHIPIILLTAKADVESRIKGIESGADLYISKPFNREELKLQVYNILKNRERIREKYTKPLNQLATNLETTSSTDISFIGKVNKIIDKNINEGDLNVLLLARELGVSERQIHRKFKGVFNTTPGEYIRTFRLAKAAKLLRENRDLSISEIAYTVGFSHLSSFTKAFRKHYGLSPTDYTKDE
jgi:signal transduction histidine kinase/ligand-binding sensor domain-containing protein/DNA-binding response OmpR family regulator